ncbi:MAG: methyl-accepting chemotaxis protein [Pirellulaceae bacterium]|nr:methyl-accepting chemotaxis protein [Pirellulaceae bacterium]
MNHLRIRTKLGLIVGILVLCVLVVAVMGYRRLGDINQRVQHMVDVTSQKVLLTVSIRANLQGTRRMEIRAVLTPDDKESQDYATQTQDVAKQLEATYADLDKLIEAGASPAERQALQKFDQSWQEYRTNQEQVLKLAVENSNVKSHALAAGKLSEKVAAIQQAAATGLRQIERLRAEALPANDAKSLLPLDRDYQSLARLQVLALDMHRQVNLHVYDTTDEEMDRLDEQFASWQKEADERLAQLAESTDSRGLAWAEPLSNAFRELRPLTAQLQKLLRANTNARSAELMSASNPLIDDCMTALADLIAELDTDLKDDMTSIGDTSRYAQWLMVCVPLVCIALSLGLAFLLTRSIVGPLAAGVAISESMAQGDMTRRLNLVQRDEVGLLGRALDHVAAAFGKIVGEIRSVSRNIGTSASDLSSVSHQVLAQSEEMTAQAGQVASSTEQMATNITTMAAAAEEMSMNVASISSASEEISVNVSTISAAAETTARNVTTVAAALQESTHAFETISHDARDGSQVANRALGMADGAGNTMKDLERSASDIGKVTEAIKMIALQTNLLALNATIEATSAGEAGKGFAVVAHEIKELANQSAQAAEDIARKIEGVQGSTRDAVAVIHDVQQIIYTLNASSLRISESIDKQSLSAKTSAANLAEASQGVEHIARSIAEVAKGANDMSRNAGEAATAANDMSRNASEAAQAVGDISANIHGVSQATRDNTTSAQHVNAAAQRLAAIATQLQQLVGQFKIQD